MNDSDPPPSSELTERPMPMFVAAGWALGATLAFFLLVSLMVGLSPGVADDLISQVACQAGAYLLAIFFILRVHAPTADAGAFLAFRRTSLAFYPLGILLGAAFFLPAGAIFNAIIHRFPLPVSEDPTVGIFLAASLPRKLVMGGVACVAGPLLEELLFRGALFKPLRKTFLGLATPTIITTALLFALVHVERQRMVHVGLMGLGLGFIRKASGSIVPSTLVHVTYNAVVFAAAILFTASGNTDVEIPVPNWAVAASTVAAIGLLGLIHLTGKHSEAARRAQELDQA
jgi:hypothetical protein